MPYMNKFFENAPSEEIQRRVSEIDLWSSTSLKSPKKEQDPILFSVIGTLVSGMGFSGVGAALATGVLTALATTSVIPGISMLKGE